MRDGAPSLTAQRVAAARASFDRAPADHGDPRADEALATDVAREAGEPLSPRMSGYLQARTRFFDRCTVNAIARGDRQVVIIGAGYDGRALRYARPGVTFWEVDHPGTQADKLARMDRLGLEREAIVFIGFELEQPWLAAALTATGFEPDAPALILCEGLLVYLELPVVTRLLDELRSLAAPGIRLALSCAARGRTAAPEHERFRERVAALGEPARNALEVDALRALLPDHRWRAAELSERATAAGFVVATPIWKPARRGAAPTAGRIGRYLDAATPTVGEDGLAAHLAAAHGIGGCTLRQRDLGVFEVTGAGGRRLIARVFPAARAQDAVERDARLLSELREIGFPAERPAEPIAVSRHDGQAVLVTEFVAGARRTGAPRAFLVLGELLGRLHAQVTAPTMAPGGAWHHLVPEGGTPGRELDAARELLSAARVRVRGQDAAAYDALTELLAGADDAAGMTEALTHPDFVPANAIGAEPTIVDWAGAGRAPRLWSLAFLLWAADHAAGACVEQAMTGYGRHIALQARERDRLAATITARPAVLQAWTFATGRRPLADLAADVDEVRPRARRIAARALAAS